MSKQITGQELLTPEIICLPCMLQFIGGQYADGALWGHYADGGVWGPDADSGGGAHMQMVRCGACMQMVGCKEAIRINTTNGCIPQVQPARIFQCHA